ncbi:hypothetical protein [Kribbella italica]|uniref:Uncharacterized protein n=1 Tax=Kribbella italica TaxID=1540520 RepID=A0A7W9J1J6_9ACTN|nr:hypothetical protein [Kribbella italica]MBB5833440.1 hypothetical protein [Kribbella italica]
MTTFTLKYDEVRTAMLELAAERPDFNYHESDDFKQVQHCVYVNPKTKAPSCLVAAVVDRVHGPEALALLADAEDVHPDSFGVGGQGWPRELEIPEGRTAGLLSVGQDLQDQGYTWGYAVAEATRDY